MENSRLLRPALVTMELPGSRKRALMPDEALCLISEIAEWGADRFHFIASDRLSELDHRLIDYAAARRLAPVIELDPRYEVHRQDLLDLRKHSVKGVMLSIHSGKRAWHNDVEGLEGAWDAASRSLADAVVLKLPLMLRSRFLHTNMDSFREVLELVKFSRCREWWIEFDAPHASLGAEDFEHFFADVVAAATTEEIEIVLLEASHLIRYLDQHPELDTEGMWSRLSLVDCRSTLYLSAEGMVFPHRFCTIPAGDVRRKELVPLLNTSSLFTSLRDSTLIGASCSRCQYADQCGGSRLRAYLRGGNMLGPDPGCRYSVGPLGSV
ncbi:MAG TPA: radical SAM/SPASM domain-containing protein [Thermoanaerobaculia bacterium]|nr:radical SAM/SPASM domain-containing protein [Thermoanaerobaculia bacterium]